MKALIILSLAAIVAIIIFPIQNLFWDFILRFGSALNGI